MQDGFWWGLERGKEEGGRVIVGGHHGDWYSSSMEGEQRGEGDFVKEGRQFGSCL